MTFASDRRAPTCPWGKCDTINPIMPSWFYWGGKAVGPRVTNGLLLVILGSKNRDLFSLWNHMGNWVRSANF